MIAWYWLWRRILCSFEIHGDGWKENDIRRGQQGYLYCCVYCRRCKDFGEWKASRITGGFVRYEWRWRPEP